MGGQGEQRSWVENDFVDAASSTSLAESDPWDRSAPPAPTYADAWPERQDSESDAAAAQRAEAEAASDFVDEFEAPSDFADELTDVEPGERSWDDAFDSPSDWAEPDPAVDASSELGESLYPEDLSITDISRELKIGELLARVHPITLEQRARCQELLSAYRTRQLRRLIPWLCERVWCGTKVALFLEFRHHWESSANVRWREMFWWDDHQQMWMPTYQQETLTLRHTNELVEMRGHRAVEDVIDPSWFEEWEECAAWEHGVRSFASFAVFRAAIPEGEDWQQHLVRQDRRTRMEIAQCVDGGYVPFMLPSFTEQYGCSSVLPSGPCRWPDVTEIGRSWRELIDRLTGY